MAIQMLTRLFDHPLLLHPPDSTQKNPRWCDAATQTSRNFGLSIFVHHLLLLLSSPLLAPQEKHLIGGFQSHLASDSSQRPELVNLFAEPFFKRAKISSIFSKVQNVTRIILWRRRSDRWRQVKSHVQPCGTNFQHVLCQHSWNNDVPVN